MEEKSYRLFAGILLAIFPWVANSANVVGIQHNEQYAYFCQAAGINVLEKSTGKWTSYTHQNGMLPVGEHQCITLHHDTLWVGSSDGWVTTICGDLKDSWQYNTDAVDPDYSHFPVTTITIDNQGRIGLLFDYGVGIIDNGSTEYYLSSEYHSSYGGRLYDIAFDAFGNLWIAGDTHNKYENLCKFTYSVGIDYVLKNIEKPDAFRPRAVHSLTVDDNNNVWFNSGNQLVKYDGATYTPYAINFYANDMAFDKHGRLWLAGEKGGLCCCVNGETTFYPYQEETWNCLDIDGDIIYIGTQNGVLKFENGEFIPFDIPDLTTAIVPLPTSPRKSTDIYDLQGRRLSGQPTKGVYIQNGKKVVIK